MYIASYIIMKPFGILAHYNYIRIQLHAYMHMAISQHKIILV